MFIKVNFLIPIKIFKIIIRLISIRFNLDHQLSNKIEFIQVYLFEFHFFIFEKILKDFKKKTL